MLRTIDPIVRNIGAPLLIKYFDSKKINHRNVDWTNSADLLRLDIEKVLKNKKLKAETVAEVLNDFYRIKRISDECKEMPIPIAFFLFVNQLEEFERHEYKLFHSDPYKELMVSLLYNGKVVGLCLAMVSMLLILAEAISNGFKLGYVALSCLHFILGLLTVFFFNQPKEDNHGSKSKKTHF